MSKEYTVYLLNNVDWVAAVDKEQAIDCWESATGMSWKDDEEFNEIEVEGRDPKALTVWMDEERKTKMTFDEYIQKEGVPCYVATSEW